MIGSRLIKAMRVWSGWGGIAPSRDDSRLIQQLGPHEAGELLPLIRQFESDFYASDARFVAANMEEMVQLSKKHFMTMHPELDHEVAEILAWCYSFDFK